MSRFIVPVMYFILLVDSSLKNVDQIKAKCVAFLAKCESANMRLSSE